MDVHLVFHWGPQKHYFSHLAAKNGTTLQWWDLTFLWTWFYFWVQCTVGQLYSKVQPLSSLLLWTTTNQSGTSNTRDLLERVLYFLPIQPLGSVPQNLSHWGLWGASWFCFGLDGWRFLFVLFYKLCEDLWPQLLWCWSIYGGLTLELLMKVLWSA